MGGKGEGVLEAQGAPVVDTRTVVDLRDKVIPAGLRDREQQKQWNTKKIGQRMAVDAVCAGTAGGLVAPVICMIDRAIIENASGKRPLMQSIRAGLSSLLFRPHRFLTSSPFLVILSVYGGTYLMANTVDTVKSTTSGKPASTTTSGPTKFVATSAANLSLGLYKDSRFAKLFGTVSPRPVPPATYALWAVRDCLTIFASFNLPPVLAPSLPIPGALEAHVSRASAAQFLAPAAIQLLSTPFHLLGLDLYNRHGDTRFRDRLAKVRVDWLMSSLARMCRIVPAFGVGGVVNNGIRKRAMAALE